MWDLGIWRWGGLQVPASSQPALSCATACNCYCLPSADLHALVLLHAKLCVPLAATACHCLLLLDPVLPGPATA